MFVKKTKRLLLSLVVWVVVLSSITIAGLNGLPSVLVSS